MASFRKHDKYDRIPKGLAVALCAISMVFIANTSNAQSKEAQAEALFHQGVELMNAGQFEKACPKFEDSQRTDPSSGTLLNLASCYERTNRPASAWATYKAAAALAEKQGQSDRVATANARIGELQPGLPKLRILAEPTPGLVVKRNGLEIGASSLNEPIFVDPGEHKLEASAPGRKSWSESITIPSGPGEKSISVPALGQSDEDISPSGPPKNESSGMRTASYVLGGFGLAAIAAGGVFGGLAMSERNKADPLCPNKKCSKEGFDLIETAKTKALVSTLGFGVGAAALGAGVTLFFLSRPSSSESEKAPSSPAARILPALGPGGAGFAVLGSF